VVGVHGEILADKRRYKKGKMGRLNDSRWGYLLSTSGGGFDRSEQWETTAIVRGMLYDGQNRVVYLYS